MSHAIRISPSGNFDDSWRRLPWILLAALIIWALLLGAFAGLLEQNSPMPESKPVEARLIEIPPAPAGLKGGHAPAPHPAAKPKPHSQLIRKHPIAVHHRSLEHRRDHHSAPLHEPAAAARPAASAKAAAPAEENKPGVAGGTGAGNGAGAGGDAGGARAIYAPMPKIPDDLREDALNTVAVAAFQVAADGSAQVTLARPTPIPRLNYFLLATLKQWRFFPAVKDGQPVASAFELRIPITIQ
jgi:protein TonB